MNYILIQQTITFAIKIDINTPADENYSRVREHCCSKGKNRGAELSICNLKYNIAKYIPSVFHSGSHYKHKSFSVLIRK